MNSLMGLSPSGGHGTALVHLDVCLSSMEFMIVYFLIFFLDSDWHK